jgi:hypothetical protein
VRTLVAVVMTLAVACSAACSSSTQRDRIYGALTSRLGESLAVLGWNTSLDAVHVSASLCTQGDINEALLYATIAIVGTHAAVWTTQ